MQTAKFLAVIALIGVANAAVWRNSDGSTNSKICWCTAGGQRLSPCSDVAGQYHNGKFVTASGCSSSWRSGRKLRGGLQSESEAEPTATAKDGLNESESEAEPIATDGAVGGRKLSVCSEFCFAGNWKEDFCTMAGCSRPTGATSSSRRRRWSQPVHRSRSGCQWAC